MEQKMQIFVSGNGEFTSEFENFLRENSIPYSKLAKERRAFPISTEQAITVITVVSSALTIVSSLIKIREWYSGQKKKRRKGKISIRTERGEVIKLTAKNIEELTLRKEVKSRKKLYKKRGMVHRTRSAHN